MARVARVEPAWRTAVRRGLPPARRRWLISFTLLMGMITSWNLASPLYSGPDEPAHVIKAAAVVRGQIGGREVSTPDGGGTVVRVPSGFARADKIVCFVRRPNVSADCAETYPPSDGNAPALTRAGRYPPLYYVLVGFPSLPLSSSGEGVYLVRLLSGALCAAFLASALASAFEWRRCRLLVIGVALALTPMVFHLAGIVSPNSLEVCAAICLWVSGIALVQGPARLTNRKLMARVGLSASTLVLMRGLTPALLILILLVLAGLSRRRDLLALARASHVRRWLLVFAVSSTLALVWLVAYRSYDLGPPTIAGTPPSNLAAALRFSSGRADLFVRQMIGVFGWLDTPAPYLTYYLWVFALGFLLLLALALSRTRVVMVTLGTLAIAVVVPAVLEGKNAQAYDFIWQGRYTLPFAVGVPILAAYGLGSVRALGDELRRVATVIVAALGIAHVSAFVWALRRYSVGRSGKLLFFLDGDRWNPPLSSLALILMYSFFTAGFCWWLRQLTSPVRAPAVISEAVISEAVDELETANGKGSGRPQPALAGGGVAQGPDDDAG